jgi:hypothetical protein
MGAVMAEMSGLPAPANHNTHGSRPESWATPQSRDFRSAEGNQDRWDNPERTQNLNDQMKAWATPRAGKTTDENPETWALRQANGDVATMPLTAQVKAWATPRSCEHKGNGPNSKQQGLCNQVVPEQSATKATGKLNPRWVETLMGLSVGWTMPSCIQPVTIVPTSCASSATE